jgi:hypothetical protein
VEKVTYRGKRFTLPELSPEGFEVVPRAGARVEVDEPDSPILRCLNTRFDLAEFRVPRRPLSLGILPEAERAAFSRPGLPRTLDLPIKFPGSAFRVPREFAQLQPLLQRVADAEMALNRACYDEYYAYLTVDQGRVPPGALQREAPCHVDGFQGARWQPKVKINHSYVISDVLPTVYYPQPFEVEHLDIARHNFFWEFNRQVAAHRSAFTYRPRPYELSLMDAYTVHRGDAAPEALRRTWVRVSFEVRIFDRLGNAHNPRFHYRWEMVPRDLEGLGLVAFDERCDPSLRVYPWQRLDGSPHPDPSVRTQPNLRPGG